MSGNTFTTTDLSKLIKLDTRARGFVRSVRAVSKLHDALLLTLCTLPTADQRFLMQILAWRMEGGTMLTATEGLIHQPLLIGMGFSQMKEIADNLIDAGIIEFVATKTDDDGNPLAGGFRWPDLDRMLLHAMEEKDAPTILGANGRALR